jgi:predicted nucleic acid-binding protein
LTLDDVSAGSRVFVDSTIFIYHFTRASHDCRRFLERCEKGEVKASTSVVVVAEVAHRLMMIEAVAKGLLPRGNLARRLRTRPDVVKGLELYQQQVEQIPLMGVTVLPLDLKALLHSKDIRSQYGLLVNDSLVVATATLAGVRALATADSDFARVSELETFEPTDLQ